MNIQLLIIGILTIIFGLCQLKKRPEPPIDHPPTNQADQPSGKQPLIKQTSSTEPPNSPPRTEQPSKQTPVSVNYHLTRQCNYKCGFCFHTATSSYVAPLKDAKKAMSLLKDAGMRKINFAGGEPFMNPKFLGQLAQYCKATLHLESVSIVTNGSKVSDAWLQEYGKYIDIMAVSCDSFNEETNVKIGRGSGKHLEAFKRLAEMCETHGVFFKVNTVVNRYNYEEDMNAAIESINPTRWKCFQVLIVPEENGSEKTLRDAREFLITDEQWRFFCDRHKHHKCFVPEGNDVMASSYLLLDEYLCFLNKGVKEKTKSILEVGVEKAMEGVYWDEDGFIDRGGIYPWSDSKKAAHPELMW